MSITNRLQAIRTSTGPTRVRILIAAAIALLLVFSWKTLASGEYVIVGSIEGESMKGPKGSYVVKDKAAEKGKYLRILSNGSATGTIRSDGTATNVGVRASGTPCDGMPRIDVLLNGKKIGSSEVTESFSYHNFPIPATAKGKHKVAVTFTNDRYQKNRCDRNLHLDRVVLSRAGGSTPTVAPTPTPTAKPTPTPAPAPTNAPQPTATPLLDSGFENGLIGWNIAGVGDVVPTIVSDIVRTGNRSAKVILTGTQERSELILGGNGGSSTSGMVKFTEGQERFYAFSFNVRSMQYGRPGAHNVLMQFKSDGSGSPNFGLMLWDYQNKRGLWTHGSSMGGDRYLRPIAHNAWQDVVIHFKASRTGQGFYKVYLNGQLIDERTNVSMIRPDRTYAYIKNGIYRNGKQIPGTSEIRLDAARLGTAWNQVSGQ